MRSPRTEVKVSDSQHIACWSVRWSYSLCNIVVAEVYCVCKSTGGRSIVLEQLSRICPSSYAWNRPEIHVTV